MKNFPKIIALFLAVLMMVSGLSVTVLAEPEDVPVETPAEGSETNPEDVSSETSAEPEISEDSDVASSEDPGVNSSEDSNVESSDVSSEDSNVESSDVSSEDPVDPPVDPEPAVEYAVDVWVGANGNVVANGREISGGRGFGFTVDEGDSVEFVITPNEGYELESFEIDGVAIDVSGSTYILSNVSADSEINITFKEFVPVITDYEVILESEGNGTLSAGDKSVKNGKTDAFLVNKDNGVTVKVIADEGYELKSLTVNGNSVAVIDGAYLLKDLTENVTVKAVFEEITYDVTFELVGKGSVEIRETHGGALIGSVNNNGTDKVSKTFNVKGISIKFFITADGKYQVFCQEPNRVHNEDTKTYYISPITMDSTITVEFTEGSDEPIEPPVDTPSDPSVDDPSSEDPSSPEDPGDSTLCTLDFSVEMGGWIKFGEEIISAEDSHTDARRVVPAGEDRVIIITPVEGYEFEFFKIDGVDVEITENTYTFQQISANMKVEIGFKKISDPNDNVITSDEIDWEQENVTVDVTDKVLDKSVFDNVAALTGSDKYVTFTNANGSFRVPYGKTVEFEGDSVQLSILPLTEGDDYNALLEKYGDNADAFKAFALSAKLPEGTLVSFKLDALEEDSELYVYANSLLAEKAELTLEDGETSPVAYSGETVLVIATDAGAELPDDSNDESSDDSVVVIVSDDESESDDAGEISEEDEGGNGTVIVIIIIVLVAILGAAALFIVKWRQEKF